MSADDHRISPSRIAGLAAGARRRGVAGYLLPALAAAWPAAARAAGGRGPHRSGGGYALTFDDGPHPQGTPAVLEVLARERVHSDLLPRGRAGSAQPGARRARSSPQGTASACIATATATCCACPARGARGHRPRRGRDRARPPGVAPRSTARPTACSTQPRCGWRARRGWRTLLWSHWGRDWEQRATRDLDRDPRHRRRRRRLGAAAARRRRLLRARLLAAHRRRAAAVIDTLPSAGSACRRLAFARSLCGRGAGRGDFPGPVRSRERPCGGGLASEVVANIDGLSTAVSSIDSKGRARCPLARARASATRWWVRGAAIVWLAWVYDAINNLAPLRTAARAIARAATS